MGLLSTYKDTSPGFNQSIQADLGTWHGWAGSVRSGYKESLTSIGINMAARAWAGHQDRKNGIPDVTKESFEKRYQDTHGFDYKEGETESQLELRYQDYIDTQVQQRRSQGVGGVANFAGGMLGNMASPADIAISMVPYAGMAKVAKAASISARTKASMRQASIAVRMLERNKHTQKLMTAVNAAAGTEAKSVTNSLTTMGIMGDMIKGSMIEQAVTNGAVWYGSSVLGREYGALDYVADNIFGTALISVPSVFGARNLKKQADMVGSDMLRRQAISGLADGADFRMITKILQEYSDDVSGPFKANVAANPRIQALMEMTEEEFNVDPKSYEDMNDFLFQNKETVWLANLKGVVPLDTNLSIPEARAKQHAQMERIIAAKRGDDVTLTPEENAIVVQHEQMNRDLVDRMSRGTETVYAPVEKSLASANPETGRITIDMDKVRADWDNDLAHLKGEGDSESSAQKREVFKDVDLVKLKEILGTPENYARFIELHEMAHINIDEAKYTDAARRDWLHPEAIAAEIAANNSAAEGMGIKLPSTTDPLNPFAQVENANDYFYLKYGEMDANFLLETVHRIAMYEKYPASRSPKEEVSLKKAIDGLNEDIESGRFSKEDVEKAKLLTVAESKGLEQGDLPIMESVGKDGTIRRKFADRVEVTKPDGTVTVEQRATKPIEQAAMEAEGKIEAEIGKAEKVREARAQEELKEMETTAQKASIPMRQTMTEVIKRIVHGDFAALALDLVNSPADLKVKFDEFLGSLGDTPTRELYTAWTKEIMSLKYRTRDVYKHAETLLTGKLEADPDVTLLGQELVTRLHRLMNEVKQGRMTEIEALREFQDHIEGRELAGIVTAHNNLKAQRQADSQMGKGSKTRLKWIKSLMDGLPRIGVTLGRVSIAADMSAQQTKDMAKMRHAAVRTGLLDLFDSTVPRVEGEADAKYAERQKMRLDASNNFMRGVLEYYRTNEVPAQFAEDAESFKIFADAVKDTLHSQVAQLNEYGAGITLRQDHYGISPRWDNETIRKMGFENFRQRVDSVVDWDRVVDSHGGVMVGEVNADGFPTKMVPFEKEEFIKAWYRESISPVKPHDHISQNIAASFAKSRMIHIKEGQEFDVMLEFSGYDSLGRLFQDQVRHRSEMIAVARNFGNNPLPNFDIMMKRMGLDEAVNTTRDGSGSKVDKLATKTGFADKLHMFDVKNARNTAEFLTGALDNPASRDLSFWFKTYRQISHIAFLPLSGISAITDIPLTLSTLDQLGATNGLGSMPQLLEAMTRAAFRRFLGDDLKMTQYYEGSGAGFDAVKNAGARRLALAEANGDTIFAKGAEAMFTWNGLNFWTAMMQEAYTDILTQSMGRMAKSGNWDRHMKFTMDSMGFTAEDYKLMQDGVQDINGVDRVGPPSFAGTDLEMKLLGFFSEFRDQAVMVPDASTQALVRFGSQAGTFHGEAIRSLMQYASFPTAMNRISARKLMVNHGGTRPLTTGQLSYSRLTTYLGTMLAFAYMAMVMKDLAKGRGPVMPWEMNQKNLLQLVDQSGIFGVVGNLMMAGAEGNPSSVISPNVSTQLRMGSKLVNDGFGAALYAGRAYTGGNLPFGVGDSITSAIAFAMQGSYAESLRIGTNFLETELGVERLVPIPSR